MRTLPSRRRRRGPGRRPARELVDAKQVEALAAIGCTIVEIAYVVECSPRTISERFMPEMQRGRGKGQKTLRRLQWNLAKKGHATMLVWLGKQMLGQRDSPAPEPPVVHVDLSGLAGTKAEASPVPEPEPVA